MSCLPWETTGEPGKERLSRGWGREKSGGGESSRGAAAGRGQRAVAGGTMGDIYVSPYVHACGCAPMHVCECERVTPPGVFTVCMHVGGVFYA